MGLRKGVSIFALETGDAMEEVAPEELAESTSELNETHDEVVEGVEEIEEMEGAMDEGTEVVNELTDVSEVVKDKMEDGEGMSEDAAKMVEVVIESMRERFGLPKSYGKIPATENFKAPRTRVEATRVAYESVVDFVKKVWTKIVEFCKMIFEKIKGWIAGFIKNYGMLEKHLMMLKTKAEAMNGKAEKSDLDKPGLAKFFSDKGGKASFATAKQTVEVSAKLGEFSEKVLSVIKSNDKILDFNAESTSSMNEMALSLIKKLEDTVSSAGLPVEKKEGTVMVGPLAGHSFLNFMFDEKKGTMSLETTDGKDAAKTITAMTKEQTITLLDMAIVEAKKGKDVKKAADLAEGIVADIRKGSENVLKRLAKASEGENAAMFKQAAGLASSLTKVTSKVVAKVPSLHFSTLKHVGDYAAASMGNMKAEKAAK